MLSRSCAAVNVKRVLTFFHSGIKVSGCARACVCQRGGMARLGLLCMLRGEPDATQQYAEFGAFLVSCISHRRLRGMALV